MLTTQKKNETLLTSLKDIENDRGPSKRSETDGN